MVEIAIIRRADDCDDVDCGYVAADGVIRIVVGSSTPDSDVELYKAIARVREDPRYRE